MINLATVPQWLVYPIEGKKDWYRIVPDPEGILPRNLAPKDDSDSVIIARPHYEWRLQYIPINLAGGDVYELVFLLDPTFRRTDLFRKDSQQGVNWSRAASWEGKNQ